MGIILSLLIGYAQASELPLLRRWAVMPFETEAELKSSGSNAWWRVREMLTARKKFLVASRQLLEQKDAYQPRRELKADDAKLLSQVLEADVIVVGYNKNRNFTLQAYLGSTGTLLWSKSISFHPSLKASDQLELIAERLTRELIFSIPYDGFTINDPLIGKTVYENEGKLLAIVDFGKEEVVDSGAEIQWVQVQLGDKTDGALQDSKLMLVAEGQILSIRQGVATVQILRKDPNREIKETSLVRLKERKALSIEPNPNNDEPLRSVAPELLPSQIAPLPDTTNQKKAPVFFAGSGLGLIGLILLLL